MKGILTVFMLLFFTAANAATTTAAPASTQTANETTAKAPVVTSTEFTLSSPNLANNHRIAFTFTCDGKNLSPELNWTNPPPGTQSFVLELYSPDSLQGIYYNWIVYNISPSVKVLEEGANKSLPGEAQTAANSSGDYIYRGPCPPDSGLHHYVFEIIALDSTIDLSGLSDMEEITNIINRHKIKSATITSLFSH